MNPLLPARTQEGLVLASASPRRAQILDMLGFEFSLQPTDVEDGQAGDENPLEHARLLARLKAESAARERQRGVVIGADTIVVIDDGILEKPTSMEEALQMLKSLRGRWHTVHTGLALVRAEDGGSVSGVESTEVLFHAHADDLLVRYVETGEPFDKAGAYAIQGYGALLVREIRGCFYNVMGLPIGLFVTLLDQLNALEVDGAG